MKSCPTCNRTFEDTFTFCLADGSLLDAPFDPHATLVIPQARQTEPPPTGVLQPKEEAVEEIPPTVASPQPEQKAEELVSTIAAPVPAFSPSPSDLRPKSGVIADSGKRKRVGIIIGVLILVVIAIIVGITTFKDSAARHANAASKLSNQEKHAEAEAEYRQALKLEPDDASLHFYLALNLSTQKKYTEMEAEYRAAIRLKPNEVLYHFQLATYLEQENRYKEAEAEFREILRVYTGSNELLSRYHFHLGKVLAKEERYTEAKAEYQEAIRLNSKDSSAVDALKQIEDK